jgi:hypothetical protein
VLVTAASGLARGRVAAQALMVDACTITDTTSIITDDLTGQVVRTQAPVYSGPCKVQTSGSGALGDRTDVGQVALVVLRLELHMPVVGSENVHRGGLVTITASATDAALVGRTFRVRDLAHKSWLTARRLQIEEVT